jgi:hypothetical protein
VHGATIAGPAAAAKQVDNTLWQIQDPSDGSWHNVGNPFYLCPGDIPPQIWDTSVGSKQRITMSGGGPGSSVMKTGTAPPTTPSPKKVPVLVLGTDGLGGDAVTAVYVDPDVTGGMVLMVDTLTANARDVERALNGVAYLAFGDPQPAEGGRIAGGFSGNFRRKGTPAGAEKGAKILRDLGNSRQTGSAHGKTGRALRISVDLTQPKKR